MNDLFGLQFLLVERFRLVSRADLDSLAPGPLYSGLEGVLEVDESFEWALTSRLLAADRVEPVLAVLRLGQGDHVWELADS